MRDKPPVLEAIGISRSYPGVRALRGVDLALHPGEVKALVGENGAGKSTLIRIFGGIEQPSSGIVRLHGTETVLHNAQQSHSAGISIVSQEFRLVPQLTVTENIFLGHEVTRLGLIRPKEAKRRAVELLAELDLELDPSQTVGTLSIGDQQMVEIVRALSRRFDVLIMDEPTAALSGDEVNRLLALVRRLRNRGKAVLYVSHRLDEVFDVSDGIAVFRDGCKVADLPVSQLSEKRLVELMLGREFQPHMSQPVSRRATADDRPIRLQVKGLTCPRLHEPVSFSARRGEILGLSGPVGCGRTEIMQSVFGMLPSRGEIRLDGEPVSNSSPASVISSGIFLLSEDRKSEGILPHLNVLENMVISASQRKRERVAKWVPSPQAETRTYTRLKQDLKIRVDRAQQLIGNLSGGNQQKVLLGRAMLADCGVLLLNEPTRGVDIGAKEEIYHLIKKLARAGVTVLVSTSDTSELVALADRCLVLRAGRVMAELTGADIDEKSILAAALRTKSEEAAS
ncbi:L-arabinose ABC transporter ATP-binding protein AraG [Streptomyces hygroscopicus subsp. sporocinereus]|uniref:L-arabinose ABC transporter ATP-binding protein AraG n=2 Tax=Streptomyces TaxID=1883 RepID=A0ABQ3TS91_STRHY|nr:sugar ABC transporter ATP-binding protein [Streptomyces hygroscopicus]GHJ25838.1 L-arabinose ABC transporter ATP-binding protein AraG [Streptomyces hygroscopicus]